MKANQLVTTLGIADSTIRNYAQEFAEYLSPSGTGGAGKHRDYTEHDQRVLKLIRDMKQERLSTDDMHATLSSLQAGGWERLPALDDNSRAIIATPAATVQASADRSAMQREIELLRAMLKDERGDRDDLLKRLHRAEQIVELVKLGVIKPDDIP